MRQLATPWGGLTVETDGPGAVDLYAGEKHLGLYSAEDDAIADIEIQALRIRSCAWRIVSHPPSGDPLPVYVRDDDAWKLIGNASTRAAAESIARASGGGQVEYHADMFGVNGDECWEILR